MCSRCSQVVYPKGMNCLDIRPEEVAIAALEMLSLQTYETPAYKEILGYKIETEVQEQTATRRSMFSESLLDS